MSPSFVGIAASTRAQSLNKKLLAIAAEKVRGANATVTLLDYERCDAPLYQNDDFQPFPPGARYLADALASHDGIIIASPEYNWSMPGALKNLIDWLSVAPDKPLKGKHALLMCASPSVRGGILGLNQLSLPLSHLGVYVYPHLIAIGEAEAQLSNSGGIFEKDDIFLSECVTDFVRLANSSKR